MDGWANFITLKKDQEKIKDKERKYQAIILFPIFYVDK